MKGGVQCSGDKKRQSAERKLKEKVSRNGHGDGRSIARTGMKELPRLKKKKKHRKKVLALQGK